MTQEELALTIEHTLLKPEATVAQIDRLCDEAVLHGFHGVCVNPAYVSHAARRLSGEPGRGSTARRPVVVTTAGFPLGACSSEIKAEEARRAMDEGAREVDMVAFIGALIDGDYKAVSRDIAAVAHAVHQASPPGRLKVILETGVLTNEQIIAGCRCAAEGEADFVKTSTGFHPSGGARTEHVRLLYKHASPIGVKAAGGIRDAATALAMIEAGAARIGTSSGVAIVSGFHEAK
jgi:deoxyribose-phosphate aldolase